MAATLCMEAGLLAGAVDPRHRIDAADATRDPVLLDATAAFLLDCGAAPLLPAEAVPPPEPPTGDLL